MSDPLPYDRHALPRYLDAKLVAAKELYNAGRITRPELFRCEVDRSLLTDTGPIRGTGLAASTTATTAGEQPARCEVCGWTLAKSADEGCVPGNCSYRPREGSDEWYRIKARREQLSASTAGEGGSMSDDELLDLCNETTLLAPSCIDPANEAAQKILGIAIVLAEALRARLRSAALAPRPAEGGER